MPNGERSDGQPLVLTDLNMPRMNGRELIARLLRQNPRLRILLTSGSEQTLSETDARNVAFLGKPFTREALASQVRA